MGCLVNALGSRLPTSLRGDHRWKALRFAVGAAGQEPVGWIEDARTLFDAAGRARLGLSPAIPLPMTDPEQGGADWLDELLLNETRNYLANTLLRDADCVSMAHSLELRTPLVDREVFALAGTLGSAAKLNLSGGKRILREAFAEVLPPWILDDQQKKTFTLPLMRWSRTPAWQERIRMDLLGHNSRVGQLMDAGEVAVLLRMGLEGPDDKRGWLACQRVWLLFVLENWLRRHLV